MPAPQPLLTPEQIAALNALVQGAGVDPWEGEPPMQEESLPPRSGAAKELRGDVAVDRYDQAPAPAPPPDPLDELPQDPGGMQFSLADDSVSASDPVGSIIRPDAQQNADRLQRAEVDNMVDRERVRMAQDPLPPGMPPASVAEFNSGPPEVAMEGGGPGAVPAEERQRMAERAGEVPPGPQGGAPPPESPPTPEQKLAGVTRQLQDRGKGPSEDLQQAQRRSNGLRALRALLGVTGSAMSMAPDQTMANMGRGIVAAGNVTPAEVPMANYAARQAERGRDQEALDMKQTAATRQQNADSQTMGMENALQSTAIRADEAEMEIASQAYELDREQRSTEMDSEESQMARERARDLFNGLDQSMSANLPDDIENILENGTEATLAPYEEQMLSMLDQQQSRRGRRGGGGGGNRPRQRSRGNTTAEIRAGLPESSRLLFDMLATELNAEIPAGADMNDPRNQQALREQREIAALIESGNNKNAVSRAFIAGQIRELRDNEREAETGIVTMSIPGMPSTWHHTAPGSRSARYHENAREAAQAATRLDRSLRQLSTLKGRITNVDALRIANRFIGAAVADGADVLPMLTNMDQWDELARLPDDVAAYLREFGRVQTAIRVMEQTGVPQRFELEDIQRRIPTPSGESTAGSYINFIGATPQQLQQAATEYREQFEAIMLSDGYVPGPGRRGRGQLGQQGDAPENQPRAAVTQHFLWVDESGNVQRESAPRGSAAAIQHMQSVRAARAAGRRGGFMED